MRTFQKMLLAVAIDPQEIGRRIKAARVQRGWTQLEFASEANVSPSTVTRWERGILPPVRELIRVSGVLGIDSDDLVEAPPPANEEERWSRLEERVEDLHADVRELLATLGGGVSQPATPSKRRRL